MNSLISIRIDPKTKKTTYAGIDQWPKFKSMGMEYEYEECKFLSTFYFLLSTVKRGPQ